MAANRHLRIAGSPKPSDATGTVTVRVSRDTHARLRQLAEAEGMTLSGMLDRLVDDARRWAFFRKVNRQMADWEADTEAWAAYEDELRQWDALLLDADLPQVAVSRSRG